MPNDNNVSVADNGWNDYAIRDNTLNQELNDTPSLHYSEIEQEWDENWFQFDHEDEVSYGAGEDDEVGMTNFVGKDGDSVDQIDYMKFALDEPVQLSFSVVATDEACFTLYQLDENEGVYSLNQLQTVTLTKDPLSNIFSVVTDAILIDGNAEHSAVYYISVESTNADRGGQAYYCVTANEEDSIAFHYGEDDDWTDVATQGAQSSEVGSIGTLNATMTGSLINEGWVGYCDSIDYCLFSLDANATVCFGIDATDDATFTVYELETNDGTFSLKQLLTASITPEEQDAIETNGLELQAGVQYAYSVESPKANDTDLGHAHYNLYLSQNSSFIVRNTDSGWNDELDDRKLALTVIGRDENSHFTYLYDNTTPLDEIMLDKPGSVTYQDETNDELHNFVGTENDIVDGKDYAKIRFVDDAYVRFTVTATAAVTISIYRVVDGIAQLMQTSKAKLNSKTQKYTVTTSQIYLPVEDTTVPGDTSYYISVAPTKENTDVQAYYRVTLDEKSKIFQGRNGHYDDGKELEEKGPLGDIGLMKKETIDKAVRAELREQGEVTLVEDWVGHNDLIDYKLLKFNGGAIANFTVSTTASGKFYVYKIIKEDDGTYTLKRLKKISLKAGTKEIGDIQFDAGSQYAICMESTVLYADNSYTVSLKNGNLKLYVDADDNTDNWLLKDNSTVLNEKIRTFTITKETHSINVDEAGSVTESPDDEYENYVGPGDTADVVELKVERNTALAITIDALSKIRFKIIEVTQPSAKKYKVTTLLTKTINPQQTNGPVPFDPILLLSGGENVRYYAVAEYQAKDGSTGYYNVDIQRSTFAPSGGADKTDDNPVTADFIPSESGTLTLAPITLTTLDDWIGFGDTSDCRRFNLEHDAVVCFDLSSQAATSFYLYSVNNGRATKLQTTSLLKQANGSYKNTSARIHLKAGSYAFEMKLSSKVAKKFEAYSYTVELNTKKSAIFEQINPDDDWRDSSKGVSSESLDKTTVGTLTSANVGKEHNIIQDDWVCLGDTKDCKWFTVADDTVNAAFTCYGKGNGTVKFGIYSIVRKNKKTYTTKKLFENKGTADADGTFSISTGALQFLKNNNYVIIVQSTTAKNCGYAKYSVTLNMYNVANKGALEWDGISDQSASLDMPQAAGIADAGQNAQDDLSFGQSSAGDMLAGSSAAQLADLQNDMLFGQSTTLLA